MQLEPVTGVRLIFFAHQFSPFRLEWLDPSSLDIIATPGSPTWPGAVKTLGWGWVGQGAPRAAIATQGAIAGALARASLSGNGDAGLLVTNITALCFACYTTNVAALAGQTQESSPDFLN
jgi:hypothetical protein